jgi:hypothetical protein
MIRAITLITGETLISKVQEIDPEVLGQPDCELINPYVIFDDTGFSDNIKLVRWKESTTRQNVFQLSSDKILIMYKALDEIEQLYEDKVSERKSLIDSDDDSIEVDEVYIEEDEE